SATKSNHGVATGTAFVLKVHGSSGSGNARVYVLGFEMAGQLDIHINGNGKFYATGTLSFNFFDFATFQVDFYFDSQGNYWFYGSVYVQLGSDGFNIHGGLSLMFASASMIGQVDTFRSPNVTITSQFVLRVDGGVTAFGFDFASVGAAVEING